VIKRIWHGWTTHDNADTYEALLRNEVFPGIVAKQINGFLGMELLRADHQDEVEFITIMTFASLEAIKAFAGDDYEVAYVPDAPRRVLSRWDKRSSHYETRPLGSE